MGIVKDADSIKIDGVLTQEDAFLLNAALKSLAKDGVKIDMTECNDVHTSALQQLCAHKLLFNSEFAFSGESAYRKAIEGFYGC